MQTSRRVSTTVGFFVISVVAAGTALANDKYSRTEAEQYIRTSEAAWAESVASNDSSIVQRILAEDFVWVLDGEVLDKPAAVAGAAKGPHVLSNHLDYAHVRFFGETAVVQGSEAWTGKDGTKGHFVWIDTWVRRNGQWQIVAAEDISVPIKTGGKSEP